MHEAMLIHETIIIAVVCLCITALIIALMYFKSKTQLETHKTLQRVLESNAEITPEIQSLISKQPQQEIDRRRGIFLIAFSFAATLVLFFLGGMAWMFGIVPLIIGVIYLALAKYRSQ